MTLAELLGWVSARARHGRAVGTLGSQGSNLGTRASQGGLAIMACRWPDLGIQRVERVTVGDGNRTRTISLGIRPIQALDRPDLGSRHTASDRHGPYDASVNGPPMARGLIALGMARSRYTSVCRSSTDPYPTPTPPGPPAAPWLTRAAAPR
jgi:hypothetical protein